MSNLFKPLQVVVLTSLSLAFALGTNAAPNDINVPQSAPEHTPNTPIKPIQPTPLPATKPSQPIHVPPVTNTRPVPVSPVVPPTPSPINTTILNTPPSSDHIVVSAVMAQDVRGDELDPMGVTDSFPENQSIFHAVVTIANAPANTKVKVVWLTENNAHMGEFEMASEGSRNIDFTFTPNAGHLPVGRYKVDVYVNGIFNRTLRYTVGNPTITPPVAKNGVAPTAEQSSQFIESVTMAENTQGANRDPVNPTTTFKTTDVIHAIVTIKNAPANTKFKAAWYVVDVGNIAAPNSLIDAIEFASEGSRNIDFTLKPTTSWPKGSYRVEISVNGVIAKNITYTVQ